MDCVAVEARAEAEAWHEAEAEAEADENGTLMTTAVSWSGFKSTVSNARNSVRALNTETGFGGRTKGTMIERMTAAGRKGIVSRNMTATKKREAGGKYQTAKAYNHK
jgi:hypothetical protein